MRFRQLITGFAALLLSMVGAAPAHAVLGEPIADKQPALTVRGLYSVSQSVTESTIAIREYANAAGVVFAVSWEGPVRPDLSVLLGQHFSAFTAAVANRPGERRRDVNLSTGTMLVQMGAHLRSNRGRVVLTALLPPGVSIAEIQ